MNYRLLPCVLVSVSCASSAFAADEFLVLDGHVGSASANVATSTKSANDSNGPLNFSYVTAGASVHDSTFGSEYGSAISEAYGFGGVRTVYGGTYVVTNVDLYNGRTATSSASASSYIKFKVEQACRVKIVLQTIVGWTPEVTSGTAWYDVSSKIRFGDFSGFEEGIDDGNLTFERTLAVGDYWFSADTAATTYGENGSMSASLRTEARYELTAEAVPEPASMLAVGFGAMALVRRRRA